MPQINNYSSPAVILPLTGSEVLLLVQNQSGNVETVNVNLLQLLPQFTVANLPAVTAANQGYFAYATNGRNTGEGSGSGTGCMVTVNKNGVWAAVWSGAAVQS